MAWVRLTSTTEGGGAVFPGYSVSQWQDWTIVDADDASFVSVDPAVTGPLVQPGLYVVSGLLPVTIDPLTATGPMRLERYIVLPGEGIGT